jgi:hypothetical protein
MEGSTVVYNNEIHILGGDNNPTKHYKWNGSQWVSASTLPYNFIKGSAVVLNNEIHILGGVIGSTRTKHYKWDGSQWVSVSTLPCYFFGGSAVVLNSEIHILGGESEGAKLSHSSLLILNNHLFVNDQPVNAENILTEEQMKKLNNSAKELTSTLTAGSMILIFKDASITSDTIVDNVLTSEYGVIPEDMTISNGSLTLTFDAQASDIGVKVVIR